jgi:hypothetical protein
MPDPPEPGLNDSEKPADEKPTEPSDAEAPQVVSLDAFRKRRD